MRLYGNYDYENEYTKQIKNLEEFELERMLQRKKVPYQYRTKTVTSGKIVEAEIYPVFYRPKDVPRTRVKKTRKAQQNLNDKNAKKYLVRLINTNFCEGDFWCTFTFAELVESIEEAERVVRNFIKRLNYRRKKRGLPNMKYIYVLEVGEKGKAHCHIIMDNLLDRDTVENTWNHGKRNQLRRMNEDDFKFTGMAIYLSKDPKGKKRWYPSKGLKKPKETNSYSKFRKRRVLRMARDHEVLKEEILKEYQKSYPDIRFLDADVRYNEKNGLVYIYARMMKKE